MSTWIEMLPEDACAEGVAWAAEHTTPQEAWDACTSGSWMLWAWWRAEPRSSPALTLAACACARLWLGGIECDVAELAIKAGEAWARSGGAAEHLKPLRIAAYEAAYEALATTDDAIARACYAASRAAMSAVSPKRAYMAAGHEAAAELIRKHRPTAPEIGET